MRFFALVFTVIILAACQAPLAVIPERIIETKKITLGDVQACESRCF
jgi:hypothetical protein